MKVVLFCGGLGMRIRDYPEPVPKPMITIGYRPLLWHVMKYYAHFGHKDFILCLGYRADVIKNYFLQYNEYVSNNFIFGEGGKKLQLLNSDIHDWNITFVDTGMSSNVGQRLKAVEPYLEGESEFLANYSDGLTDLPLPDYLEHFRSRGKVGSFLAVRPHHSYHVVSFEGDIVKEINPISKGGTWINGGFFAFRGDIFKYLKKGEELVELPFQRLIEEEQLLAHKYEGFWACMDTFKDKEQLENLYTRGEALWEVWKSQKSNSREAGREQQAVTAMLNLRLREPAGRPVRILCLGAHSDDIEIGCGGAMLTLLEQHADARVRWIVFSATEERGREARRSAEMFLAGAQAREVEVKSFRDGYFPFVGGQIKDEFETLKLFDPDLVFTHYRDDRHQDHRLISELTWNTFRNHLILEYEIPKYDGDLGAPNFFVPLSDAVCARKTRILLDCFASQRGRQWFDEETFLAILRLRGMEANAPSRYAEAFYCRKMVLGD